MPPLRHGEQGGAEMPSYEWKGRDRNGTAQTGVLIGDTKDAVIAAL